LTISEASTLHQLKWFTGIEVENMTDVASYRVVSGSHRYVPVSVYLLVWATVGLVTGFFIAAFVLPEMTGHAFSVQSASQAQRVRNAHLFVSDAGMVLNFIKPDKTSDFETIVGRLRDALQKSDKPERQRQAAGWKVFKAMEPGADGSVLYVFTIESPVKDADYAVSAILAEAFPAEGQALYKKYAGAYATGQNVVNLTLLSNAGR
jgi:hypothetical protein